MEESVMLPNSSIYLSCNQEQCSNPCILAVSEMYCFFSRVHTWEHICAQVVTQKCVFMCVQRSQPSSFQSSAWLQSYVSLCREHTHNNMLFLSHTHIHLMSSYTSQPSISASTLAHIHWYVCIHVCLNAKEGKKQETKDKEHSWGPLGIL